MTDPAEQSSSAAPGPRRRTGWFGAEGFLVSVLIHAGLLLVATFWVLSTYVLPDRTERFDPGRGGGTGGERAVAPKSLARPVAKPTVRTHTRILSVETSNAHSPVVLPEAPSFGGQLDHALAIAPTRGFGGGMGGGIGSSLGSGTGKARNFVGLPVMGMNISGKKIAVYLDNSGSMRPFLDSVEKEIRDKFPTADVFRYYGIFLNIEDNEIVGTSPTKKYATPTASRFYAPGSSAGADGSVTRPEKLSVLGREIYNSRDGNFRAGSVGAWVDTMINQKYDTLIIFSDFADGIRQWRKVEGGDPLLVHDADLRPVLEKRTEAEKAWENRWLERFSKAPAGGAPRLFIFSTDFQPQEFWKRCVDVSGGEYKMIELARYAAPVPAKKR